MVLQIDSVLRTFENWFPCEQNNTHLLEHCVNFDWNSIKIIPMLPLKRELFTGQFINVDLLVLEWINYLILITRCDKILTTILIFFSTWLLTIAKMAYSYCWTRLWSHTLHNLTISTFVAFWNSNPQLQNVYTINYIICCGQIKAQSTN